MAGKRTTAEDRRSRYFQDIAAAFFRLRGAPFVLSSGDMVMIADWERAGIPLGVVEEGIRRASERARTARPAPWRLASLAGCDRDVRRAFQEHRDRRVGRASVPVTRSRKAGLAEAAVRAFLDADPAGVRFLREVYGRALALLSAKTVREEELDRLEEQAERLILEEATGADREAAEARVRADFPGLPSAERPGVMAVELVRRTREKHGIPHLSLYYY